MKRQLLGAALVATVAGASYIAVDAQTSNGASHVRADLNGYQENLSVSTTGHGRFTAKIDDEARTIEFELTYADLDGGPATGAHIHFGARDNNGGIAIHFCGTGGTQPCPGTAGTVTGIKTAADVVGPAAQGIEPGSFDELVRAIRAGVTYVNVHTPRWPGGEIRGQVANNSQREPR